MNEIDMNTIIMSSSLLLLVTLLALELIPEKYCRIITQTRFYFLWIYISVAILWLVSIFLGMIFCDENNCLFLLIILCSIAAVVIAYKGYRKDKAILEKHLEKYRD